MVNDDVRHTQIGENLRFIADMRFKQLTLQMGVLTLVGAGLASYDDKAIFAYASVRQVLCAFALLFNAVAWVMEIRSSILWFVHYDAAKEVWLRPPPVKFFKYATTTVFVLLFNISVYTFWLCFAWGLMVNVRWVFLAIGLFLLVYSIAEYSRKIWQQQNQATIKAVIDELRNLDVENLAPDQAIELLRKLKERVM